MQRINWIDYSKFLGIFLVVLGHTSIPKTSVNFIYAFHMPLFFFVSGYLFNTNKYHVFGLLFKARVRQLILPYFFFSILTYLFWFFVGRKFGNDASSDISPLEPLFGILYATDSENYLIHCGSLWFLPCLFIVEIIYYKIANFKYKTLALFIIAIISYFNIQAHHELMPLSLDAAIVGLFFYMIGNVFRDRFQYLTTIKSRWMLTIVFFAVILLYFLTDVTGRSDMSSNVYGNYPLFLVSALVGITLTICISSYLETFFKEVSWAIFFAKSTLIILSLHSIVASVLKGIAFFGFKIPLNSFENTFWENFVLSIISFVCLVPVILIINRFFPFLIGRISLRTKDELS